MLVYDPAMQATLHELTPFVRGFDCGPDGGMHLLRLCNLLQDAADSHANELGVGARALMAQGMGWMLTRMRITVTRMPQDAEQLRLITWPEGSNRLYAWRQYRVLHGDELLVQGASAWVVADIAKRAVARMPQSIQEIAPPQQTPEPLLLGDDPAKGAQPQAFEAACRLQARNSDLDHNGHVNNGVLCQWLVEPMLPLAAEQGLKLAEVEVRFKKEMAGLGVALSQLQRESAPEGLLCRHLLLDGEDARDAENIEDASPLVVGRSLWRPA